MNHNTTSTDYLHKEYPKQFEKTEFWKQIKRTVHGEPVSDQDIDLIVEQIGTQLNLKTHDHVLDLGCGNGALASKLFPRVARYTGVDFSEYLLSVADEYFRPDPSVQYVQSDIRLVKSFARTAKTASKVLVYGCIGYLHKSEVEKLLGDLKAELPELKSILIGNVADRSKAVEFFRGREVDDYCLDDPKSAIGVWWAQDELMQLGSALGFQANCVSMPVEFYATRYRFDLVLTSQQA